MMNRNSRRVMAGLVLAALTATTIAPAAQAGEGRGNNKRERVESRDDRRDDRRVERRGGRLAERRAERWGEQRQSRQRAVKAQRHVEYRPRQVVRYVDYRPYRVVRHARYHRHHQGSNGLAFLGGLVLGAVITRAAQADHYYYADPYCDLRFSSLDAYHSHVGHHRHPTVVHVVEIRTGDWVDSYHYDHGNWRYYDTDDWDG
jgi:hypothetical protein